MMLISVQKAWKGSKVVRRDGLAVLCLIFLAVIFFWRLALTELIIGRGDVFFYFYPYRDYASAAVRAGRIPLWNPFLFMGVPFLANSQAGFFYPPNLLLAGLPVERMVSATLTLHAALAATGAYLWGRRGLGLGRAGAWLAGVCFGLGGYFTAQVEHVNQVQVLAWLPWALCLYEGTRNQRGGSHASPQSLLFTLLLGGVIGLGFLAGHTQSVFISLVGLAGYAWLPPLARTLPRRLAWRPLVRPVAVVLAATALGAGLGAVQLLPTLELSRLSVRSGGLPYNEAVSFSLNPALLGRALLPGWDETLFPEFVAHVGVLALALGLIGLLSVCRSARRQAGPDSHVGGLFLTALGLFLALGGYNPVYFLLVKLVPGFALFRAPARWLALYGLGMAGLVGLGFDELSRLGRRALSGRGWLVLPGGAGLLALGVLVGLLLSPDGDGGATHLTGASSLTLNPALSWVSVGGWLVAAWVVAMVLLGLARGWRWLEWLWVGSIALELFGASTRLPFNRATAPGALTSLRPAVAHLLAEARAAQADSPDPPARFLSISDVFFDPGDKPEIEIALGDQLSEQALYDYLIATKQKEVLIPNLPLYYRLPTADGYDGGVLPLRRYVTLERLFMPEENVAIDGRLRENLDSLPPGRWLSLFNVRYVVTDKSGDAWFDGVFYDLQHEAALGPGDEAQVGYVPDFAATALGVVYQAPDALGGGPLAEFELTHQDGSRERLSLLAGPEGSEGAERVARLSWGESRRPALIQVRGLDRVVIRGLSLIDERTDTFQALVLSASGHYRLVHSGDVKIYENLDVLPRAFFVSRALFVPDDEAALAAMRAPDFDPATTVVLDQAARPPPTPRPSSSEQRAVARFVSYEPERMVLEVTTPGDGWLVLTDAWYPGWQAQVDGEPARIERANILFRAIAVAGGRHRVVLVYRPGSFRWGSLFSLGALVALLVGVAALVRGAWVRRA